MKKQRNWCGFTPKWYFYQIVEPCPMCGEYNTQTVSSINPDKTRITPFHEDDMVRFSCGHLVKALGLTVKRKV